MFLSDAEQATPLEPNQTKPPAVHRLLAIKDVHFMGYFRIILDVEGLVYQDNIGQLET